MLTEKQKRQEAIDFGHTSPKPSRLTTNGLGKFTIQRERYSDGQSHRSSRAPVALARQVGSRQRANMAVQAEYAEGITPNTLPHGRQGNAGQKHEPAERASHGDSEIHPTAGLLGAAIGGHVCLKDLLHNDRGSLSIPQTAASPMQASRKTQESMFIH